MDDQKPQDAEVPIGAASALTAGLAVESISGALSGIAGVDALLAEAGFLEDSSVRHQLSIVASMLAPKKYKPRICPHCGGTPGLTGGLMCCDKDW